MSDRQNSTTKSNGWMGCAVQHQDGRYFSAMISDDADGVIRFHIDRDSLYPTADAAIEKANYGRGLGYYRKFSHAYEIVSLGSPGEEALNV